MVTQATIPEEERLRHERDRLAESFRALLALTLEPIVVHKDGVIAYANAAALQLIGATSASEIIGLPILDFVHADSRAAVSERIETMRATGEPVPPLGQRLLRLDGEVIDAEVAALPVQLDGERVIVASIRELTHHNLAREVVRRLAFQARLLDAVGQSVIATRPDGTIEYWNSTAENLYGYAAEEAIGRNAQELLVSDDARARGDEIMAALSRGTSWSGEFPVVRKDGSIITVFTTNTPLRDADGRITGVIGVSDDVTERRRAQEELDQARRQLAVSEKLSAIGTLVAGVAHEIRTPLAYVSNNLYLAKRRAPRAAPDEVILHCDAALEGVERISRLVSELRRFSRNDEPSMRRAWPIHEVVAEAVHLFEATHPARTRVDARLRPATPILMDRAQLQQVVLNLLSNAADASPPGVPIRVATGPFQGGAQFMVEDDGVGIPPAAQARMFDPFFTTKPDGTGLGLPIVRRIVESHGGALTWSTGPGKPTRFTVTLPAPSSTGE